MARRRMNPFLIILFHIHWYFLLYLRNTFAFTQIKIAFQCMKKAFEKTIVWQLPRLDIDWVTPSVWKSRRNSLTQYYGLWSESKIKPRTDPDTCGNVERKAVIVSLAFIVQLKRYDLISRLQISNTTTRAKRPWNRIYLRSEAQTSPVFCGAPSSIRKTRGLFFDFRSSVVVPGLNALRKRYSRLFSSISRPILNLFATRPSSNSDFLMRGVS